MPIPLFYFSDKDITQCLHGLFLFHLRHTVGAAERVVQRADAIGLLSKAHGAADIAAHGRGGGRCGDGGHVRHAVAAVTVRMRFIIMFL